MTFQETNAELWLRPSPGMDLRQLQQLVRTQALTRTPRLGIRDQSHPKGYTVGHQVRLRLLDSRGNQQLSRVVAVTNLIVRRLSEFTAEDLAGCGPAYRTWEDVGRALAFFEKRRVLPGDPVTIVEFTYHTTPTSEAPL